MKFKQLPIGGKFESEGMVYTKVTPLLAKQENGAQKLFRQSETVTQWQGDNKIKKPLATKTLDKRDVLNAFIAFYTECETAIGQLEATADASSISNARDNLSQARLRFLETLAINPGKPD